MPIPGFSRYLVSRRGGLVYSTITKKILKPFPNIKGYQRVRILDDEGYMVNHFIHRLVSMSWQHNKNKKPQVHHCDFNILNNNALNLLWVTNSENQKFNRDRIKSKYKKLLTKEQAGTPF